MTKSFEISEYVDLRSKGIRSIDINPYSEYNALRFWSKVAVTANEDLCWEWQAFRDKDGYGMFQFNRKAIRSNRFAYWIWHKHDPADLLVCHKCDNPACCNPKHLFLGTHKVNIRDCHAKGRHVQTGEKNNSAKITEERAREMIALWDTNKYSQIQLSKMFGIARSNVGLILAGKTWPHLGGSKLKRKAKFAEQDVLDIRRLSAEGKSNSEIAKLYGTEGTYIKYIVQRKFWTHI